MLVRKAINWGINHSIHGRVEGPSNSLALIIFQFAMTEQTIAGVKVYLEFLGVCERAVEVDGNV
jgi:hypothetical protein